MTQYDTEVPFDLKQVYGVRRPRILLSCPRDFCLVTKNVQCRLDYFSCKNLIWITRLHNLDLACQSYMGGVEA